jgi:uncharacterized membrane protein
VHFPIAFLTLSWSLDILYALTTQVLKPTFLTTRFAHPTTLLDITRLGHFMLCAGLIMTIPTIMSGNIQLVGMIKKNGGPWAKDANGKATSTMVPKIKATISHALVNDLVFAVGIYSWYTRRAVENIGNVPSQENIVISAVLLPMLMFSAALGGSLTYNHGVGLNLGRKKVE